MRKIAFILLALCLSAGIAIAQKKGGKSHIQQNRARLRKGKRICRVGKNDIYIRE